MKIPEKSGDWVLVYPNCPNVPNTLKHFTILEQSLISSRMISWRLEVTFCIILPMILGISPLFGPSFLPKNPKTGETQPSNGFYTWVRLQFYEMWSLTLLMNFCISKTMICGIWTQFLGPALCPKYTKTGINQPSDDLYIWVRFQLMWNVEFNCLDHFLCVGVHDLEHLDPICPTCPNSPNILKQFAFTLE